MKIYCEVNDQNTRYAASILMKHYRDEEFLNRLRNVSSFNFTDDSPSVVAHRLPSIMDHLDIKIVPYKSINPFSKAIGYAEGTTIYLNTRKLYLPYIDRVENIYHEATHLCGYSHNGNRATSENLKSVPYLSASIFASHIKSIYG
ncbi:MAG: hypothetical protein RLZ35_214 [Pseudomonadota bacterium]|jgi:hypothetical protein